jgi:hypothetical protein
LRHDAIDTALIEDPLGRFIFGANFLQNALGLGQQGGGLFCLPRKTPHRKGRSQRQPRTPQKNR